MDVNLAIVIASLIVGLLVGLTGVGAGAAMTPLLVSFFGVPLPTAIATDLLFATITKAVGAVAHGKSGSVNWQLTKRLWTGSIPAVLLGSILLVGFVTAGYTQWLTLLLVAFVAFTSFSLLQRAVRPKQTARVIHKRKAPRWLAPLGGAGVG